MHAFSLENVGCSLTGGLLKGTVFKTPKIDTNPQKFFPWNAFIGHEGVSFPPKQSMNNP